MTKMSTNKPVDHSQQTENAGNSSECWEFFDKIYCVSVDERADRRDEARTQFQKVGLLDRVEFVIVKKDPVSSEQGIYESHINCLKKGIRADASNIMIFEDDVVFERFSVENLRRAIEFLSTDADWNAIFWGCLVSKSRKTKNKSVLEVRYRSLTHACVLNRKFAEIMVKAPWQGIAYDAMLKSFEHGLYTIYPSFAFQNNLPSDNYEHLFLDKFRRLCGGLKSIQKLNELYHRNRCLVIALHFLVILIVALLVI